MWNINSKLNKDVHCTFILIAIRFIKSSNRSQKDRRRCRYLDWPPWSAAATYPFGRPIANRSAGVHTPIIYTAIVFRQVNAAANEPTCPDRARYIKARMRSERYTDVYTMHRAWSRSHDALPQEDEEQRPRKEQRRSRYTARRASELQALLRSVASVCNDTVSV